MQQHPVPQNIASFEFKLIGDLTLKQFAYLAAGIVLSGLLFASPTPGIIKWPLTLTTFLIGSSLAFVPVGDRPMDQWLFQFFKATYRPTQYLWKKSVQIPDYLNPSIQITTYNPKQKQTTNTESKNKLQEYLKTLPQKPKTALDIQEESKLKVLTLIAQESTPAPKINTNTPIESMSLPEPDIYKLYGLADEREMAREELKKEVAPTPLASNINFTTEPVVTYQQTSQKTTFMPAIGSVRVRKLHTLPPFIPEEKTTKNQEVDLSWELKQKYTNPSNEVDITTKIKKASPFPNLTPPVIQTSQNQTLQPFKQGDQFVDEATLKDLTDDIKNGATVEQLKQAYPELTETTIELHYKNITK